MGFVLTLIAVRRQTAIDAALLRALARLAPPPSPPQWLSARTAAYQAVELRFAAKPAAAELARLIGARPIDFALQPSATRAKKLLCIDMESTLIEQELLDEMAAQIGAAKRVAELTERAMRGEMDFAAALRARLACLRSVTPAQLDEIAARIRFAPGAEQLVRRMQAKGAQCCLVTGGFRFFAEHVRARLPGFAAVLCNDWQLVDGLLTGELAGPLVDGEAKAQFLRQQLNALGLQASASLAVGDGANDVPMLRAAGFGVAYRAKPAAEAAADAAIRHTDLSALLYMQGYGEES